MTEPGIEPEETAPVQPEQTSASEAPSNPFAEQIATSRAEFLGEEITPAIEDIIEPEVVEPEKVDDNEEARVHLASEKRSREERETLKTEREDWVTEQAEARSKMEAYDASLADVEFDPFAHLKTAGLTDEALMDLGREIFFEFMPENVTPEIKAEMARTKSDRRVSKLERLARTNPEPKAETEAETKNPDPKMDPKEYESYEADYKTQLSEHATAVDSEKFPLGAALGANSLKDAMFAAAVQHAKTSPNSGDLSPLQTVEAVEKFLKQNPEYQAKPEESRPSKPVHRSLRSRTVAAKPDTKQPQTHDEKFAAKDAEVRAKYGL